MNNDIDNILYRLSKSKFRSSFHLNKKMKEYCISHGYEKVKNDAYYFINNRLKPKNPKNDGKQTPMKQVHPVFISQHACACCCRSCLYKWHSIPKNKELTNDEVDYIVNVLMKWITEEISENIKK